MNESVYDKAVQLLSIRLHTTGELRRKLEQRGFENAEILPVLRKLEELGFLDDQRFAEIFTDNLKRYKDWGYYAVKAKLAARLVPGETAEAALAGFYTPDEELAVAQRLYKKLSTQGRKTREQIMRSLASKGFRSDTIRRILSDSS